MLQSNYNKQVQCTTENAVVPKWLHNILLNFILSGTYNTRNTELGYLYMVTTTH